MAVTSWDGTTLRGITGKPKWENPCKIPGHVFDSSTDLTNTPPFELDYLYRNVKGAARSSRLHANASKIDFLNATFKDPDFNEATLIHRQNWLPTLPPLREPYFRSLTKEEAFKKSYELMQYFMVGIEQIIMDQVIHGGQFVSMFRKVENYLTQVLCELQYGLVFLRIPTSPDVTRDVMSQEYRDIAGRASRNLRDYLILRDYVEAAEFVEQLFTYLLERTLKENN